MDRSCQKHYTHPTHHTSLDLHGSWRVLYRTNDSAVSLWTDMAKVRVADEMLHEGASVTWQYLYSSTDTSTLLVTLPCLIGECLVRPLLGASQERGPQCRSQHSPRRYQGYLSIVAIARTANELKSSHK